MWQSYLAPSLADNLEDIFEAMADGMWVCDREPRLLWVNSACEKLNDVRREAVFGRTVADLLGSKNFDSDVTRQVLREKRPVAIVQTVRSGRQLLVTGVPVFDEGSEVRFIVGNERDLSELNLLKSALEGV